MSENSSQAGLLVSLQHLDSRFSSLVDSQQLLEDNLQQQHSSLESLERSYHEKQERLKMLRKNKLELELLIGEADGMLQRHDEEKYRVKSQHEFEALEKEIRTLETAKSGHEDRLLEIMEEEENLDSLIPSLAKQLAAEQAAWLEQQSDYAKGFNEIEVEKKKLERERESLSVQINRSHYTRYEQLHKARGGLAVAPVEDGVCVACNVKVSTSLIGEMRREEVVHCENCGRILYLVEKNKGNDVE